MCRNQIYREVTSRQMVKQSGAAAQTYTITHPSSDSTLAIHSEAKLLDASGTGQRRWTFFTAAGANYGLVDKYEKQQMPGEVVKSRQAYTWTQDAAQRPYISEVLSTIEPGTGNQKQSKTTQVLDVYGNVTQSAVYGYGSLTTPVRTYTSFYASGGDWATYRVRNRVLTSYLNDGTTIFSLVSNTYDGGSVVTLSPAPTEWNASTARKRGNLTTSVSMGQTRNYTYNQAGMMTQVNDGYGHSVDVSSGSGTNYARPSAVTPNSNGSMTESYTWNTAFLGLTNESGPNGAAASLGYDSYARPSSTTSATGAVTTYAYTNSPRHRRRRRTGIG